MQMLLTTYARLSVILLIGRVLQVRAARIYTIKTICVVGNDCRAYKRHQYGI